MALTSFPVASLHLCHRLPGPQPRLCPPTCPASENRIRRLTFRRDPASFPPSPKPHNYTVFSLCGSSSPSSSPHLPAPLDSPDCCPSHMHCLTPAPHLRFPPHTPPHPAAHTSPHAPSTRKPPASAHSGGQAPHAREADAPARAALCSPFLLPKDLARGAWSPQLVTSIYSIPPSLP